MSTGMIATNWQSIGLDRLPPQMSIGRGCVDLWSIPLGLADRAVEKLIACLSADEVGRADRFINDKLRRRYIVAHAGLRLLLSRYTGIAAGALDFVFGPQGKPSLASPLNGITFNLTHSEEVAVVAIAATNRIGVDIEHLREIIDATAIARLFFSSIEETMLTAIPPAERSRAFLTCWTRKEAFVKALGGGLSVDLAGFAVNLSHELPGFSALSEPYLASIPWSIIHIEPETHYLGATVIDREPRAVTCNRLDLTA